MDLFPLERSGLDTVQEMAGRTAIYPGRGTVQGLTYTTLGLAGEAGEVANKVKKLLRDGETEEKVRAVLAELGDVAWYLFQSITEISAILKDPKVTLSSVVEANLQKLFDRAKRDTLKGDGDRR